MYSACAFIALAIAWLAYNGTRPTQTITDPLAHPLKGAAKAEAGGGHRSSKE